MLAAKSVKIGVKEASAIPIDRIPNGFMSITIGGTFSGLNVSSIISAIIAADSVPITQLQDTDTQLNQTSTNLGTLGSSLGSLSVALQALNSNTLFSSQAATSSTTGVGSAAVDGTGANGTTSIDITQLATPTTLTGGTAANAKLSAAPAGDTNIGTVLDETDVDGQTFTINGQTITLSSTDMLDDGNPDSTSSVIGKINNSGAGVTASYDATTGKITLASNSSSPIILGSGADTSDFLQQAGLFNNAGTSVTSSVGIGRIDPTSDLASAGLTTTPTAGTFTVNGVSINYTAGESLNDVIGAINTSGAGVTAVYDTYEDQMVLTGTANGPQNITVANGTSNLATALGLNAGDSTLQTGQPTLFTVNGSSQVRQSDSSVISASALGVPGMTFTATGTGTTQVSVAPDVTTIAAAINAFVTQYNSTQTTIQQYTGVDTSDTSESGALETDSNLTFLAPQLRSVTSGATSTTAVVRMLSDLGVETNANDDTLTEVNTADLQTALTNNLTQVEAMFNDPTTGLTTTVQNVIDSYNDSLNGAIVNEQNQIKTQVQYNQSLIAQMQENIQAEQTQLENEFATLDSVEAQGDGLSSILSGSSATGATATSSSSSGSTSSFGSVGGTSSTSSTSG
jgi:flagellar hook-associated protein 2